MNKQKIIIFLLILILTLIYSIIFYSNSQTNYYDFCEGENDCLLEIFKENSNNLICDYSNQKDNCFNLISIYSKDPFFCNNIFNMSLKEDCILNLAQQKEDLNLCNLLDSKEFNSTKIRDNCLFQIAIIKNDYTICKNTNDVNLCIYSYALNTNNETLCEISGKYKNICITKIINNTN